MQRPLVLTALARDVRAEHVHIVSAFLYQSRIRTLAKIVVTVLLFVLGQVVMGLSVGVVLLLTELLGQVLARRCAVRSPDPGWGQIMILWSVILLSTAGLAAPALVLAASPSFPLYATAQLWAMGLMFYTAQNFGHMPKLNAMSLLVLAAANLAVLALALNRPHIPGFGVEPGFAFLALLTFMIYAFSTLRRHIRMTAALETARAAASERLDALEHSMRHDELTGLLNRRSFDEALQALIQDMPEPFRIWVILLDLNDFKPVNDAYSHDAGDAVLCMVAERLRAGLPPGALCARMAGDEFIVALNACGIERNALTLLNELESAIAEPIPWEGRQLRVTAAIGMAEGTNRSEPLRQLCARADHAMFRAKGAPGNMPVIYSARWGRRGTALEQRQRLIEAIESDQITPFFQPKVSLRDSTIVGFEALVRWVMPDGRVLMPAQFLPWIDELGLTQRLLAHVAERVCARLAEWSAAGLPRFEMSVNVSEATLATVSGRDELLSIIQGATTGRDFSDRITLEITEDVFIARSGDVIRESIGLLRAAGCRFSLDDFGTGYASLKHLREFRFDEIKIDRSFTADLGRDPEADILVESLLTVARGLNLKVIAEGIENDEQRLWLLTMGCDTGQGFLWRRAMSGDEVCDLFAAGAVLNQ